MALNITDKEGQAMNRPPYFDGNNYRNWKIKMKIFLQCIDLDILAVVINQYTLPPIPYTDRTRPSMALNVKAMNAFHYSLSSSEFDRISMCQTAHEIWNTLEEAHEGTNQVKESRINRLLHEYEIFFMEEHEPIDLMYSRFNKIVSELHNLGKIFTDKEKNYKILRSLTKAWQPKVTAIEEAQDLSTVSFATLIGKLRSYEMQLDDLVQRKDKTNAPVRNAALHARRRKHNPSESSSSSSSEDESESEEEDDDSYLFNKFLKWNKLRGNREGKKKFVSKTNKVPTCFNCSKKGHLRPDCPLLKKKNHSKEQKKEKKKALVGRWDDTSDDEESPSVNHEVTHMCFMCEGDNSHLSNSNVDKVNDGWISENDNNVEDDSDVETDLHDLTKEDLVDQLYTMQDSCARLFKKYRKLKKKKLQPTCDCDSLQDELEMLKNENKDLHATLDSLNDEHVSLDATHQNTLTLLRQQNKEIVDISARLSSVHDILCSFTKNDKILTALSFDKKKHVDRSHAKSQYAYGSKYARATCHICCRVGHIAPYCRFKNESNVFVANPYGSKLSWIPKTKVVSTFEVGGPSKTK